MKPSTNKFIKVIREKKADANILEFQLSFSENLGKYLPSKYFIKYDTPVNRVDDSILNVPAVAGIITVAWAVGADIYVKTLDKTYLDSLNKIKSYVKIWYPHFDLSTKIYVEKLTSNKFSNSGYALFYTGGIDSTTTFIRHRNKNPTLLHVFEVNTQRSFNEKEATKYRKRLKNFARQEKTKINFIKTNIPPGRIQEALVLKEFGFRWWVQLGHALILPSLSAPLSMHENIGTIYMASSWTPEVKGIDKLGWGTHPQVVNNISWADLKVVLEDYDKSRQEKIKIIKDHIQKNKFYPYLRVCNTTSASNCSRCEKCARTITGLVLEGIDPHKVGFPKVTHETFTQIQKSLLSSFRRSKLIPEISEPYRIQVKIFYWKDIQKHIPEEIDSYPYDSQRFFRWLKNINIDELYESKKDIKLGQLPKLVILYLYNQFPFSMKNSLSRIVPKKIRSLLTT